MIGARPVVAVFAFALACTASEPSRSPVDNDDGWATVDGRDALLDELARAGARPVLLDVGASWCMPCVDLRTRTFADARVKAAIAGYAAIELDVTAQSREQIALMEVLGAAALPLVLRFDDAAALRTALADRTLAPAPSLVVNTFVAPDELLAALAR